MSAHPNCRPMRAVEVSLPGRRGAKPRRYRVTSPADMALRDTPSSSVLVEAEWVSRRQLVFWRAIRRGSVYNEALALACEVVAQQEGVSAAWAIAQACGWKKYRFARPATVGVDDLPASWQKLPPRRQQAVLDELNHPGHRVPLDLRGHAPECTLTACAVNCPTRWRA